MMEETGPELGHHCPPCLLSGLLCAVYRGIITVSFMAANPFSKQQVKQGLLGPLSTKPGPFV